MGKRKQSHVATARVSRVSLIPRERRPAILNAALARFQSMTTADRLRKVLKFTDTKLDELRPEQLSALVLDLTILAALGPPKRAGVPKFTGDIQFRTTQDLRRLQNTIASGIRAVLQKPGGHWPLPKPRVAWLTGLYRGKGYDFMIGWAGQRHDEGQDAVVEGVWNLLIAAGDQVRTCGNCGKPFVARKRQEYCSLECSQQTRNRRKRERLEKGAAAVKEH